MNERARQARIILKGHARAARVDRIAEAVAKARRKLRADSRDRSIKTITRRDPSGKVGSRYHSALRESRIRRAAGCHTVSQWLARVDYYNWQCRYCSTDLNRSTLVKEHQIALACGGSNWPANLVPSCKPCNSKKSTTNPRVFLASLAVVK